MPTKYLVDRMYNGGYQARPPFKPVVVTYESVNVSAFSLGWAGPPRRVDVDQIQKVEALVTCCSTSGRASAPGPSTGVDLVYSGFDKGHVIALELGGVDDPYNIIPQCRFLQQSGPWRKVEREIFNLIKTSPAFTFQMTVNLVYRRDPLDPFAMQASLIDTRSGTQVYTKEIANLPTNVDVRQQDKVLAKLDDDLNSRFAKPDIHNPRTMSADTLSTLATAAQRTAIIAVMPKSAPGVAAPEPMDVED